MRKNGILITGLHRAGTTWAGKMIDGTPHTCYLGEVLRPDTEFLEPGDVTYWYQYSTPESDPRLYANLRKLLSYQMSWPNKHAFSPSKLWLYRVTRAISGLPRPILKDPMAAFSSEPLARAFDMHVVCLIRHPAAVVASLRRAGWQFDFRNFLNQERLMEEWLEPILKELKGHPPSIVEQGALLWRCVYLVLDAYLQRNPDWILWRHEDLSAQPLEGFATIYQKLDLELTESAKRRIKEHSRAANPVLAQDDNLLMRNTRALIDHWRKELTSDQVSRIREIVEPLSSKYYDDDSW